MPPVRAQPAEAIQKALGRVKEAPGHEIGREKPNRVHLPSALPDTSLEAVPPLWRSKRIAPGSQPEVCPVDNQDPIQKLLFDRRSAAYAISVSIRTIDYGLARGEFDTRRIGNKVLITAASLRKYAASNHFGNVSGLQEQGGAR